MPPFKFAQDACACLELAAREGMPVLLVSAGQAGATSPAALAGEGGDALSAVEKRHVAEILARSGWNITRAAKTLGIDRVTVYNKIKKYGLRR